MRGKGRHSGLHWLTCAAVLLLCAGCGDQSEASGSGGILSLFKTKSADRGATAVPPEVGAALTREANFPAGVATKPAPAPRLLALDGVPPRATLLDQPVPGRTTTAYLIEGPGHPPLALVNISGANAHIELWEMEPDEPRMFARRREVRLDSAQDTWSVFLLSGVAHLPGDRLLLGVFYYAPQVKEALFVYDVGNGSYAKLANVAPFNTFDQHKFFDTQLVATDAVVVQYFSGSLRLGPEVYYNTPAHLRLYSPEHPQGLEILRLGADDGSIERWSVIGKTLWIHSRDTRKRNTPQEFFWSLNLEKVLPR